MATVAALVATVSAACATPTENDTRSATQGLPDVAQALAASTWVLDPASSTPAIRTDETVTLSFEERGSSEAGTVNGQAPCNTYRGPFRLDGDGAAGNGIEIGPLATTKMACDEGTGTAEAAYLKALEAVDTADVTDRTRLVLTGDAVELSFDRLDPSDAIVGTWDVTSINTGDAISSPVTDTEPTLTFATGGKLSVDAGCNPIATTWSLDGSLTSIAAPRSGMKSCPEPAGVMDQEAALTAALEKSARVDITDHLTLFDDEGHIMVTAARSEG